MKLRELWEDYVTEKAKGLIVSEVAYEWRTMVWEKGRKVEFFEKIRWSHSSRRLSYWSLSFIVDGYPVKIS